MTCHLPLRPQSPLPLRGSGPWSVFAGLLLVFLVSYAPAQAGRPAPHSPARAFAGHPPQAQPQPQYHPQPQQPQPQYQPQSRPPVAQQSAPASHQPAPLVNPNRPGQAQQHLGQWMEAHRALPLTQQQSALESEPGFHQLKPEEQQRMRNQLTRLNTMPPQQRERTLARTEWMERLQPQQRQQVRGAMAQLGSLPPDRAHAVGRAFRQFQNLPEPQRQAYLNSPQARAEFNDSERATLGTLFNVAPLIPPTPPR